MPHNKIEKILNEEAKNLKTLQFAMKLPKQNLSYDFSSTGTENQRFHSASVGKLLTASVIFKAIEAGKLTLQTPIEPILGVEILENLFVFEGKNYQSEITIRQLLGHTSGVNDYASSKNAGNSPFLQKIIDEPEVFWTPTDLLNFTKKHQKAAGRPDEQFFYADTNYILLGLIAEKIFEMPFHEVLEKYIFTPCEMLHTDLAYYGKTSIPMS